MIEVIVAAVLFVITAAGILSTIASLRPSVQASQEAVQAANYGRQILEDLRSKVNQVTWDNPGNDLDPGNHPPLTPAITATIGGVLYTGTYVVTALADGSRQVDLTITW